LYSLDKKRRCLPGTKAHPIACPRLGKKKRKGEGPPPNHLKRKKGKLSLGGTAKRGKKKGSHLKFFE